MKLQSYKVVPYLDSWNCIVKHDGIYDINPEFIESVCQLEPVESYNIEFKPIKGWFGKVKEVPEELFDKTFNPYRYTMSSGQKFLFDINFDIKTKEFKEKE